jgi:hypothetical protein
MRVYPRGILGKIKFYLQEANVDAENEVERNCSITSREGKFYMIFESPIRNDELILPLELELEAPDKTYVLLNYGFIKHNDHYFNATGSLEYNTDAASMIWDYIASFSEIPQKLSYKTAPEIC